MKIKLLGTVNSMSLKKDGEYRVELKFSLSELSKVIPMIKLLNVEFSIGIVSDEKDKAIISKAYLYRLMIDKEGESKVMIYFSFENISNDSLAFFGQHQEELVTIFIKDGKNEWKR